MPGDECLSEIYGYAVTKPQQGNLLIKNKVHLLDPCWCPEVGARRSPPGSNPPVSLFPCHKGSPNAVLS